MFSHILSFSLPYPEGDIGRAWDEIYDGKDYKVFGDTDLLNEWLTKSEEVALLIPRCFRAYF